MTTPEMTRVALRRGHPAMALPGANGFARIRSLSDEFEEALACRFALREATLLAYRAAA
jgi:hypothetical protein